MGFRASAGRARLLRLDAPSLRRPVRCTVRQPPACSPGRESRRLGVKPVWPLGSIGPQSPRSNNRTSGLLLLIRADLLTLGWLLALTPCFKLQARLRWSPACDQRVGDSLPSARVLAAGSAGWLLSRPRLRSTLLHRGSSDPLVRLSPALGAARGEAVDSAAVAATAMGPGFVLAGEEKGPRLGCEWRAPSPPATAIDRKPAGLPVDAEALARPRAGSAGVAFTRGCSARRRISGDVEHWGAAEWSSPHWPSLAEREACNAPSLPQWVVFPVAAVRCRSKRSRSALSTSSSATAECWIKPAVACVQRTVVWLWRPC